MFIFPYRIHLVIAEEAVRSLHIPSLLELLSLNIMEPRYLKTLTFSIICSFILMLVGAYSLRPFASILLFFSEYVTRINGGSNRQSEHIVHINRGLNRTS